LLLIGALGLLLVAPASAAAQPYGVPSAERDDASAIASLRRAAIAVERVSYRGTRIVSSWGSESSTTILVDVEHVARQGTLVRMRGGGAAEDTTAFLAARDEDSPHDPGLGVDSLELLTRTYDLREGTPGDVAGRAADVVEIGQAGQLVARIWVDRASGLPLRREIFDSTGQLAVESAFIDLQVTDDGFIAHLPPGAPDTDADQVGLSDVPDLQQRGWACPQQAGALHLVGVERVADALHLSYSDGLSRVSVFEQRGDLDPRDLAGYSPRELGGRTVYVRAGMPSYAIWEASGTVYTLVSDAPVGTMERVIASYPGADRTEPGFWGRVAGGLARMGAWVTPIV